MTTARARPHNAWFAVPVIIAAASAVIAGAVIGRLVAPLLDAELVTFTTGSPATVELAAGETRTVYVQSDAETVYRGRVDCRVEPLDGQPDPRVTRADGLTVSLGDRSWRSIADVTPASSGRVLIGCFGPLAGSVDFAVGPELEVLAFISGVFGALALVAGAAESPWYSWC